MQDNKQYTPELRFPEFHDDWQVKRLGEIAEMFSGGTPSVGNSDYYNGQIPFIRSGEINETKTELFISENGLKKSSAKMVKKGTLLYALYGATSGETALSQIEGAINQAVLAIVPQPNYLPYYICQLLKFKKDYITSNFLQGGQGNLSSKIVSEIKIPIPVLPEQRKIAACLSSLDDLINAVRDKVDLLKQHKKGLMQKMFPKRDCNVPELRFRDFSEDWQEKRLGDVTKVVNRRNKSNRQLPIYSISNKEGFVLQSEQFSDVDSVKRGYDISLYKIVTSNTFAYNPARINVGSIGFSGDIKEGLVSSLYVCFKTTDELDDAFLSCFFDTTMFKWAVDNNVEGGIRSYLFYENFSRIKIKIPSLKEQKRIAFCIASLDEEIKMFEDKHQKLQEHKKGLMQKMFVNKY